MSHDRCVGNRYEFVRRDEERKVTIYQHFRAYSGGWEEDWGEVEFKDGDEPHNTGLYRRTTS